MGEKRKRSDVSPSEQVELVVEEPEETPEKRQRVESVEPCTPKPLTRKNLALLEGKMPKASGIGKGSRGGKSSHTGTSKSTKKDRDKAAKSVSSHTPSQNLLDTKRNLAKNRLYINDREAIKRHPRFLEEAKKVINETRGSAMKEEERENFANERDDYELWPEADFVEQIWRILILDSRTVKSVQPIPSEENATEWILKAWNKSGLALTRRQPFITNCIPKVDTEGDAMLEALLDSLPRVATPAPDLAYGLKDELFSEDEQIALDRHMSFTRLSKNLFYSTFCIVEFKSARGTIQEAELQACRGGSAMVNAMRQLKIMVNELDAANAYDIGSISFSVAMVPTEAELFVHWAEEVAGGKVKYHMNRVRVYQLREGQDAPELRKSINNILDWGLELRLDYMKALALKLKTEFLKPVSQLSESEDEREGGGDGEGDKGGSDDEDDSEDELSLTRK